MVGLFSRFSVSKSGHRRTQSALDKREVLPSGGEVTTTSVISAAESVSTHGIEIAFEFKPVEHPTEPLDNDQPIQCPFPEPSILNSYWPYFVDESGKPLVVEEAANKFKYFMHENENAVILKDGRIWKERVSSGVQTRADIPPVMQEQAPVEPENSGAKPPRRPPNRVILPSISAPEHNILKLLEECNASGI